MSGSIAGSLGSIRGYDFLIAAYASNSSREDEVLIQATDRLTSGSLEQYRDQCVNHARDSSSDHRGAYLKRVPLVLPIALSKRARMLKEDVFEERALCSLERRSV